MLECSLEPCGASGLIVLRDTRPPDPHTAAHTRIIFWKHVLDIMSHLQKKILDWTSCLLGAYMSVFFAQLGSQSRITIDDFHFQEATYLNIPQNVEITSIKIAKAG